MNDFIVISVWQYVLHLIRKWNSALKPINFPQHFSEGKIAWWTDRLTLVSRRYCDVDCSQINADQRYSQTLYQDYFTPDLEARVTSVENNSYRPAESGICFVEAEQSYYRYYSCSCETQIIQRIQQIRRKKTVLLSLKYFYKQKWL